MYGWHMQSWGAGGWFAMALLMLVFWGLVVAGVIALVRYLSQGDRRRSGEPPDDAREILRSRLARGEIDEAEFTKLTEVLRKDPR